MRFCFFISCLLLAMWPLALCLCCTSLRLRRALALPPPLLFILCLSVAFLQPWQYCGSPTITHCRAGCVSVLVLTGELVSPVNIVLLLGTVLLLHPFHRHLYFIRIYTYIPSSIIHLIGISLTICLLCHAFTNQGTMCVY